MTDKMDIIDYLSGLTGFVFDKAVLQRIALDRQVLDTDPSTLDAKKKDLLYADLLYTAYLSPNVWASHTHSHGSYSQTTGSQTIYSVDKERIYNIFMGIYRKHEDVKAEELSDDSSLQWLE